jgi:hypothetical protein
VGLHEWARVVYCHASQLLRKVPRIMTASTPTRTSRTIELADGLAITIE